MGGQQQYGLLGQSVGSGLQGLGGGLNATNIYTTTWADSTSTVNFYPNYVYQAPIPPTVTQDPNDPVVWLKKRVKEVEWRA